MKEELKVHRFILGNDLKLRMVVNVFNLKSMQEAFDKALQEESDQNVQMSIYNYANFTEEEKECFRSRNHVGFRKWEAEQKRNQTQGQNQNKRNNFNNNNNNGNKRFKSNGGQSSKSN